MLQLTSYSYVQDSLVVRGGSIGVTQGPTMTPPKKNNNKNKQSSYNQRITWSVIA